MDELTQNLRAIVGRDAVLTEPDELIVYECDALPQHKQRPRAVVFPSNTEEVAEVLRVLKRERVAFAPRGAGTGLSGGALTESVVIEMARMRRLLELDIENRRAVVQTGLINAQLSRAAAPFGLHYVPDPSSQMTCTIGGNLAENAGGIHCLKYGMTVDHVAAARVVLAGGKTVDLFAGGADAPGYDLLGVFIGSEGTFGIATEATLRLMPLAPAVRTLLADFADVNDGSRAVSAIIAAGLVPSALEMMDAAAIRAVEQSVFAAGLPPDAQAALLIELDGLEAGLDEEVERAESICRENGARGVRRARDEQERKRFWAARKGAFGAMGRLAPDLMLQDAVVPRSRLPEVLASIYSIGLKYDLLVANVFHAGDGNLHPYICFDSRKPEEVKRVREAGREMMETCVRAGGTITGEHGVGLDKSAYLSLIFSDDDMDAMLRVRAAFDPEGFCNPGKIIPTSRSCGEARGALTGRSQAQPDEDADAQPQRHNIETQLLSSLSVNDNESTRTIDDGQQLRASLSQRVNISQSAASSSPTVLTRSPFNVEAAHEALTRIVGNEHVAVSPRLGVAASLAVSPANAGEACEILRLSSREGWAVLPAGAGTWLDAGRPARVDVVLRTNRMRRIIEHEPADLVAAAEAGLTLEQFNAELRRAGQCLPLDPPDDGRATLGGVAATGICGAQGLGYGAPRGYVIGMRVALADGRLIKAGGRVVKNVAGYDLCKLFVGSNGTLGLILELTFKLRPLPVERTSVVAYGSPSSLWQRARELLKAQLFPVALELLSARAAANTGLSVNDENDCALLIRFAGASAAVRYQLEQARALLDDKREIKQTLIVGGDEDELLWRSLAALSAGESSQLIYRMQVVPGKLGAMLAAEDVNQAVSFPSDARWQAGVGDGRMRVICSLPNEASAGVELLSRWRTLAERLGGWMIVERAPDEIREAFDTWGDVGAGAKLMRRIKRQLDPSGILSPGHFVAGI